MAAIHDMTIPLIPGQWYHIFNRGINRGQIFFSGENCSYFLKKYKPYMDPYWETHAWALMGNHFHLVIKVKEADEIGRSASRDFGMVNQSFVKKHERSIAVLHESAGHSTDLTSFKNLLNLAKPHDPELHEALLIWAVSERFRRFMLGYAKAINKQQDRTGSLFQKPFRRKALENIHSIKNAILYVHHNPIHHNIVPDYGQYEWTSYHDYLRASPGTSTHMDMSLFDDLTEFTDEHHAYQIYQEEHRYWHNVDS